MRRAMVYPVRNRATAWRPGMGAMHKYWLGFAECNAAADLPDRPIPSLVPGETMCGPRPSWPNSSDLRVPLFLPIGTGIMLRSSVDE